MNRENIQPNNAENQGHKPDAFALPELNPEQQDALRATLEKHKEDILETERIRQTLNRQLSEKGGGYGDSPLIDGTKPKVQNTMKKSFLKSIFNPDGKA